MKKIVWFLCGMAAAAAGFLVWNANRSQPLREPEYNLDETSAGEDATFV
jgi:hypothetical protein